MADNINISLEYRTSWGENLVLSSGGRLFPMGTHDGVTWAVSVPRKDLDPDGTFSFRVVRDGLTTRSEWGSHKLESERETTVRSFWKDVPEDLPFRSKVFTLAVGPCSPEWKGAGTSVPVFSLRSKDDFGIGEFNDIPLLVDWAVATGQSMIQILPIHDTTMTGTWMDSYPYNANSVFALHPQYLHLPGAGVRKTAMYLALQKELNALPAVDYERVNKEKTALLRKTFSRTGASVRAGKDYQEFYEANSFWLKPYAAFCALRDHFGTADYSKWGPFATYDRDKVDSYCAEHDEEIGFYCLEQFFLEKQLKEAVDYAHSKGVAVKGDLPIGISPTSADAWVSPELFNLAFQAGAPPDAFAKDGQNWGFPTYNWDKMAEDGFAWWRARLGKMSGTFDAFRIDHILGFFRIWEIPAGVRSGLLGHFYPALPYSSKELTDMGFDLTTGAFRNGDQWAPGFDEDKAKEVLFVEDPSRRDFFHPRIQGCDTTAYFLLPDGLKRVYDNLHEDFFYHRHDAFWKSRALERLPAIVGSTSMLACGEDLGMIPRCVPEVMQEMKLLSLEIQRMPKALGALFADTSAYPRLSVCATGTHDTSTLRAWWEEDPEASQTFWSEVLGRKGRAPGTLAPELCKEILELHLKSPSLFAIFPIQDWLSCDEELRFPGPPEEERINVPANPRHYWRYRMHLDLEDLCSRGEFNSFLRDLVRRCGRGK